MVDSGEDAGEFAWLRSLDDDAFVAAWRERVGEVPSCLLDRDTMLSVLADSGPAPAGPPRPPARPAASDRASRG